MTRFDQEEFPDGYIIYLSYKKSNPQNPYLNTGSGDLYMMFVPYQFPSPPMPRNPSSEETRTTKMKEGTENTQATTAANKATPSKENAVPIIRSMVKIMSKVFMIEQSSRSKTISDT